MKKTTIAITIAITVLLLGIGVFYCLNQNKNTQDGTNKSAVSQLPKSDVRDVVWGQMSEQQKETIDGTWSDGRVLKTTLEGVAMIGVKNKSYEGKEVYSILFPRKQIDALGDTLTVFADIDTYNIVGYGVLD